MDAFKRVRKRRAAVATGTSAQPGSTALVCQPSRGRSFSRSEDSSGTEEEMQSAASLQLRPLPLSSPLPSFSSQSSMSTAATTGGNRPRIKMSAYDLVRSVGADLSSVDKARQEAAAVASAVQQATDQAIAAMEVWGDTQLALTAATDALSAAAASSSEQSLAAVVKASQAEKKASAAAKAAALMLAQAKRDQLELQLSFRPASTAPQTPQSDFSMRSHGSVNSDDGGDDGDYGAAFV